MNDNRLLIVTQVVDMGDPTLGFFHEWVRHCASRYAEVHVVCLQQGIYDLPSNVFVYSLGKETKRVSKIVYAYRFLSIVVSKRDRYDSVFVHMNEEYVLLAGWLWRLIGTRVVLWRNHKQGTWKTRLAVWLANTVCFTSPESFTARFKKAVQMPVGIDTDRFQNLHGTRKEHSIVYVGRISPIKHIECLIDAMAILADQGVSCNLDLFGAEPDPEYRVSLQKRIEAKKLTTVSFKGSVSPRELVSVYNRYTICANMTTRGSFDKTIFESIVCGAFPVVANTNIAPVVPIEYRSAVIFQEGDAQDMARVLATALRLSPEQRQSCVDTMSTQIESKHSLSVLIDRLTQLV